jgi:hypothetical protein
VLILELRLFPTDTLGAATFKKLDIGNGKWYNRSDMGGFPQEGVLVV